MATADILGRFLWHDLMTTDQGAASAFYPKVTGWTSQPWENDSSYQVWVTPKGASGGTALLPEEAQSAGTSAHWLMYVGTPDIDSTVEEAERLGGKVLRPVSEVPNVGKFAVLADPQGAMFAVYTPDKQDGDETGGGFSWHELATSDLDAAFEFYSELFGWDKASENDMGELGMYVIFGQDGQQLGGIYKKPSDHPGGPNWLCYASVSSAADAAEAAKAAGGQVINGPMQVPGGDWIAQVLDPQGAAFAVHESGKAAAKPKRAKKSPASKAKAAAESAPASAANGADGEPEVTAAPAKKRAPAKKAPAKKKAAPSKAAAKKAAAKKAPAKPAPAKSKAAAKSKGRPAAAKKAAPKKAAKKAVKKAAPVKKKAAAKKAAPTKVVAKKAAKKAARKK